MKQEMRKRGLRQAMLWSALFLLVLIVFVLRLDRNLLFVDIGIVLRVVLAVLGSLSAWKWFTVLTGRFLGGINEFCAKAAKPAEMRERVEHIWSRGTALHTCRMDADYLVWGDGMKSAVVPFQDVIWAYIWTTSASRFSMGKYLTVWMRDGQGRDFGLGRNFSADFVPRAQETVSRHLAQYHPDIVWDGHHLLERRGFRKELRRAMDEKGVKGFQNYIRSQMQE